MLERSAHQVRTGSIQIHWRQRHFYGSYLFKFSIQKFWFITDHDERVESLSKAKEFLKTFYESHFVSNSPTPTVSETPSVNQTNLTDETPSSGSATSVTSSACASASNLTSASVTNMTPNICANKRRRSNRQPSFLNKLPDRGLLVRQLLVTILRLKLPITVI